MSERIKKERKLIRSICQQYGSVIDTIFEDNDGCWIYLKDPYYFTTTYTGICVEDTWDKVLDQMCLIDFERGE